MTDGRGKGEQYENEMAYAISEWAAPRSDKQPWKRFMAAYLPFRRRSTAEFPSDWLGQRDLIHRPDVEFPFSIECKKIEGWTLDQLFTAPKWAVWQWWDQTIEQALKYELHPLLVFSRNRQPDYAMTNEGVFSCLPLPAGTPIIKSTRGGVGVFVLPLRALLACPFDPLMAALTASGPLPSKADATACPPRSSRTSSSPSSASGGLKRKLSGLR